MHNKKLFILPKDNIQTPSLEKMKDLADHAFAQVETRELELTETPSSDNAFLFFCALIHYYDFLNRWHVNGRNGSLLKQGKR